MEEPLTQSLLKQPSTPKQKQIQQQFTADDLIAEANDEQELDEERDAMDPDLGQKAHPELIVSQSSSVSQLSEGGLTPKSTAIIPGKPPLQPGNTKAGLQLLSPQGGIQSRSFGQKQRPKTTKAVIQTEGLDQPMTLKITLTMCIVSFYVPVKEQTPITVIWQRGRHRAQTKKTSILNEKVQTAVLKEKFQIATMMKVHPYTQLPVESKESSLYIVSGEKRKQKQFGKVKLDLSQYGSSGDYLTQKLQFGGDEYPGAFIEVGLKGKVSKESGNTSLNTSMTGSTVNSPKSSYKAMDLDKLQKEDEEKFLELLNELNQYKKELAQSKVEHKQNMRKGEDQMQKLYTEIENMANDLRQENHKQTSSEQEVNFLLTNNSSLRVTLDSERQNLTEATQKCAVAEIKLKQDQENAQKKEGELKGHLTMLEQIKKSMQTRVVEERVRVQKMFTAKRYENNFFANDYDEDSEDENLETEGSPLSQSLSTRQ